MPNWCNNSVTVTHTDPAKITVLAAAFAEGRLFEAVIPVPECLKNPITTTAYGDVDKQAAANAVRAAAQAETGYESWYDFCVNEWGTKWDVGGDDATIDDIVNDGCTVSMSFESAWAPPLGVYEAMMAQGYVVVAYYWECGMGFVGKWNEGDDLYYDYGTCTSETVRGYIGDELDDYFGISESMAEWEAENDETDEVQTWYEAGVEKRGLDPHTN